MVRVFGSPGRSRRLRSAIGLTACAVLLAVIVAPSAQAVHDLEFQLDGNVIDNAGADEEFDWANLFGANGNELGLPAGFTASAFDRDFLTNTNGSFNTSDSTTFTTGSKDTLPISGWQCTSSANVNSKIDVMNAYAATYEAPNGDEILYFGMERNANTGTANVAFWFLQDDVACDASGGTTTFTGAHTDGDLLVVSEFSNGGTVSTINVYQWVGGADGSLNPDPVAGGVDCDVTLGADTVCATSNKGSTAITTPWLTSNKQDGPGNALRTSMFFEGGLNLTEADLGGKCFNTFTGDTRSSTSLTATLFDFSLGVLGQCTSDTVTTPQTGAGAVIPAAGASIGTGSIVVRDQAVVTVNGVDEFDGTVTFSLCGPFLLTNTTTNCATGGVSIGSPVAVSETNATVNSANTTLTSVGNYCWRAVFSGDATAGVPGSSDPEPTDTTNRSECFKINPVTPSLTTQASADVLLGTAISDTATLSGTATQPGTDGVGPGGTINATNGAAAGGSITWTAFGPGNCTTVAMAATSRTVSGNGTYPTATQTAVSFTPTAVGTYTFVASYSGSSPNTLGAGPSSCPPAAGDGDEVVNVTGAASLATAQRWLPNDTARITSPATTTLAGTVTFTLYNDGTCGTGTGTSQYTVTRNVVTDANAGGTANDRFVSTANTSFFVTITNDATAYSWKVSYNDDSLSDPTDVCETTSAFTLSD